MSVKTSALPVAAALDPADLFAVSQLVAGTLVSGKTTLADLAGFLTGTGPAAVSAIATATHTIDDTDVGKYLRTTFSGVSTLTVPTNATEAIDIGREVHARAVGGALTLAAASGVTLNAPAGGTLVVPQRGAVTMKKVATDEWDVLGATEPAP